METDVLDTVVRLESQPEIATRGFDEWRVTTATVATDDRRITERTVDNLQVVVVTVLRRLDVKLAAEIQSYSVTRRRCNKTTRSVNQEVFFLGGGAFSNFLEFLHALRFVLKLM